MSDVFFAGLLKQLNEIGIALSSEQDHDRLMELILLKAMEFTGADGGTLYTRTEDNRLRFEIVKTVSLGIYHGGTSGADIQFYPVVLYFQDGSRNEKMIAARCALDQKTIVVDNAYDNNDFDFSGTRQFDAKLGYRSQSFLAVPLIDHQGDVIGVLQLINKICPEFAQILPFNELDQQVVESLASQAAVKLANQRLIDDQKKLFDAFIQLIAGAIDEKSPYTGGHCRRLPELTTMLAHAVCDIDTGPFKHFTMTEADFYELEVAGWLHDCGKITTPEYVIDKSTKLETIYDRIETVDTRFEVLKRDAMIASLYSRLNTQQSLQSLLADDQALQVQLTQLDADREVIRNANIGGEFMTDDSLAKIRAIAAYQWRNPAGEMERFLSDDELKNLSIKRGTLTDEERQVINNHMVVTIDMLESLPYPKHLKRVPEYAGGHHEKMDGTGFPKGLTRDQMSVPARMMAIADIFEALTASDRPYKPGMPISQALSILRKMKHDNHIDPDLFDVFIEKKVYRQYAEKFLSKEQIDIE